MRKSKGLRATRRKSNVARRPNPKSIAAGIEGEARKALDDLGFPAEGLSAILDLASGSPRSTQQVAQVSVQALAWNMLLEDAIAKKDNARMIFYSLMLGSAREALATATTQRAQYSRGGRVSAAKKRSERDRVQTLVASKVREIRGYEGGHLSKVAAARILKERFPVALGEYSENTIRRLIPS